MQTTFTPHAISFKDVTVEAGGKRLNARVGGIGAPIVLFHSLLADQSSWDRIVPALAATHRVVVLNLPGFGTSDTVGGSLEAIADHIGAALDKFELPGKPILMGNGYGGFIALITFLILVSFGLTAIPLILLIVLLVSMAITALYGWTIERVAYRPLRGSFRLAPLISAIGMSIVLQNFVQVSQGARVKPMPALLKRRRCRPSAEAPFRPRPPCVGLP